MSRPKRSNEELLADMFADLSPAQQETMLLVLQSIQRQSARAEKRIKARTEHHTPAELFETGRQIIQGE